MLFHACRNWTELLLFDFVTKKKINLISEEHFYVPAVDVVVHCVLCVCVAFFLVMIISSSIRLIAGGGSGHSVSIQLRDVT